MTIFELSNLKIEEKSISMITIITQMTDKYPMYTVIETEDQVHIVLEELKKLEFVPIQTDEKEKGWQFSFILDFNGEQINLALSKTKAYLDDYSYSLKGYDSSMFMEIFNNVDAEKYQYH